MWNGQKLEENDNKTILEYKFQPFDKIIIFDLDNSF